MRTPQRLVLLVLVLALPLLAAWGLRRADVPRRIPHDNRHEVIVSAAVSLTEAFTQIGAAFTKANPGTRVRFNFAASGALLRQMEAGAPVDVFASASPQEMNSLQRAGRLAPGTRANFAGNRLVLIAPASSRSILRDWRGLTDASVRRIALSAPDSVPSGRYARETLTKRGIWPVVRRRAVFGENVRQTLAYVANGDVDAGIVFASDAALQKGRVRIAAAAVPGRDHAPIVYPAAVIKDAPNAGDARRFVRFLQGREAQAILARHGFLPPPAPSPAKKR